MLNLAIAGGGGLAETSDWLLSANRSAAELHLGLADALRDQAGMAGDAANASAFIGAYDETARSCLSALADLVPACSTLGRQAWRSLENHRAAERASALRPIELVQEETDWQQWVSVEPAMSVTVRGSDPSSLPGWADVIVDHVSDFIWPDADTDRLREAARSWRAGAEAMEPIVTAAREAVGALDLERSPEIPAAAEVIGQVATAADSLVEPMISLAVACEDFAKEVEDRRDEILDLVHDLLRDAVVIEAVGIGLGVVSLGIGTGAATAVNVGKISKEAPRFIEVLETLRAGSAAYAAALEAGTATAIAGAQRALARFRVPTIEVAAMTKADVAFEEWSKRFTPGWLRRLEGSSASHTVERHIDITNAGMKERIARGKSEVSRFFNEASAEALIEKALRKKSDEVLEWLTKTSGVTHRLDATLPIPTGVTLRSGHDLKEVSGLRVILRRDATVPEGFRVHTAFPQPEARR